MVQTIMPGMEGFGMVGTGIRGIGILAQWSSSRRTDGENVVVQVRELGADEVKLIRARVGHYGPRPEDAKSLALL